MGTLRIGTIIHDNAYWLGEYPVKMANESLSAYEEGEDSYKDSIIKAGSALEIICKLICEKVGAQVKEPAMLGAMIGAIRDSKSAPSELLERLGEANTIRNRAPHAKPSSLSNITQGDALQMLNIIGLVTSWAGEQYFGNSAIAPLEDEFRVFISMGRPHRLVQKQFLENLRAEMRVVGVKLINLSSSEYSESKPFDQILKLMETCSGALIVGWERYHAYTLFEREDSTEQKVLQDRIIATPWNQIEASMAAALGLPLLILRERNLHAEGIFEANNHNHIIRDFDLEKDAKIISRDLVSYLKGWKEKIAQPKLAV